jgi:hypothetical protein
MPGYSILKARILFLLLFVLATTHDNAQSSTINKRWLNGFWTARWISNPDISGIDFAVCHFRKSFELANVPASFVVHVSADNRYRLFVNGVSVGTGPARSDLANWNFESYDLAPYLHQGKNVIAATVWNFAEYRPYSQISFETAFILQGDSQKEELINSNNTWKTALDSGYHPLPVNRGKIQTYIVTAEGETLDGRKHPWDFADMECNESKWKSAQVLWYRGKSRTYGTDGNWMLVPRSIPLAEEKTQAFGAVRRSTITIPDAEAFLKGKSSLQLAAHGRYIILLDQSYLTNAYPKIVVDGGRDALIQFSYAEALVDSKRQKGNRDSIEGKEMLGFSDQFIPDGNQHRTYSPLFFRTFRYLQLDIETADEPLTILELSSIFTGYPFVEKAYFKSDDPELQKIWTIGWRTARLCAVDTYFDCPYYEQLQYVGDTRIQAMISLYVAGDERLMKKAIDDISHSFFGDGLTQSRYPSRDMQVIPTFSLWWVCMIHDFWMNRQDDAFISSHLDKIAAVMEWYKLKLNPEGMLGPLSWWQFVDWSWPDVDSIRVGGVPPGASHGGSSIITLQYAYTLQRAAQLMNQFGRKELAAQYQARAKSLTERTHALCWDQERGLMADDPGKKEFSQHANIMAVLTDAISATEQTSLLNKIITDKSITQCTYYFSFYLFEALKKTGMGDRFLPLLNPWKTMIAEGLTTFAENPAPTRSDCHAWSASPDYELLSLVCGIRSSSPGFREVLIEPALGNLTHIEGSVPHPMGNIIVKIEGDKDKHRAQIELPPGLSGNFSWAGHQYHLKPGKQEFSW